MRMNEKWTDIVWPIACYSFGYLWGYLKGRHTGRNEKL